MPIGIKQITSFLPSQRISNGDLAKKFSLDESFLKEKLGIESRPVSPSDVAASDLAVKAAEKLFAGDCRKEDFQLLILCTQNPDFKLPNTASIVQDKLKLTNSLASFDINQGCSGFIYSLAVAKSMMQTLNYQNALVITVDPYSKIIDKNDKNTALLFGDASVAIWVSNQSDNEILDFSFGTDGTGFDKLIVRSGGSRYPVTSDVESYFREDPYLRMDGRAIFEFMMTRIPADINQCIKMNNLTFEDVDYFIFHQASLYLLRNLQKLMKIPDKKMVYFLKTTGNAVSSSIPLACEELFLKKDLSNKIFLLSGFGVGFSWGSVIIKFS